jgi:hypothetical protein
VTPGGCAGHTVCQAGGLACKADTAGVEVCNGIDDDCDGYIDEPPGAGEPNLCAPSGTPCLGDPCGPSDKPAPCKAGHYECLGGQMECVGAVLPQPEACNCIDDDCSGQTDDGDLCGAGGLCFQCECVIPCKQDEFPCPGGRVCLDAADLATRTPCANPGADACFCVPSACYQVSCPPGWQCSEADGQCHDPCLGVTCDAGQECRAGRCVDCTVLGCPAGQVCAGGTCVDNPCSGVTCAPGSYCTNGSCVTSCDLLSCGTGTVCLGGECVSDPCGALTCSYAQFCNPTIGECQADPCLDTYCALGTICSQRTGECVPDPCLTTECESCRECRADAYVLVATCDWKPECLHATAVAVGSGCHAAPAARSSLAVPLLFTAGLLLRRRRRAR